MTALSHAGGRSPGLRLAHRSRLRPGLRCAIAALAALLAGLTPVAAHDFTITATTLQLDEAGSFRAEMICDLDALLLGRAPGHDPAELVRAIEELEPAQRARRLERLEQMFLRRVRVRADGERLDFVVSFPDPEEAPETLLDPPAVLGVTARLEGTVPTDADSVTFWASRAFSAVRLEVQYVWDGYDVPAGGQVLQVGEESAQVPLRPTAEQLAAARSWTRVAREYLWLGVLHIVPRGLDHILFVLGLVLLRLRTRELLLQVTTFTVAHTLTLALSTLGLVQLPGSIVEPLIALSIAYVALENLWREELVTSRMLVVFVFGLIHGLGFAGVLGELGLPRGHFLVSLLSFNVGVEIGQLLVVAVAALLLVGLREKEWYRSRVVAPLSIGIAAIGLYLALERLL